MGAHAVAWRRDCEVNRTQSEAGFQQLQQDGPRRTPKEKGVALVTGLFKTLAWVILMMMMSISSITQSVWIFIWAETGLQA